MSILSDLKTTQLKSGSVLLPARRTWTVGPGIQAYDDPANSTTQLRLGGGIEFAGQWAVSGTSKLLGETSIGDPGSEEGSILFSGSSFDAILKVNDFGGGRDALAVFHRHSSTDQANVAFVRANSNTSAHSAMEGNQRISRFLFAGWTNSTEGYSPAAYLDVNIDGDIATGTGTESVPGEFVFSVSPDGAASPVERLRLSNDGRLHLTGSLHASEGGNEVATTGSIRLGFAGALVSRNRTGDGNIVIATVDGSDDVIIGGGSSSTRPDDIIISTNDTIFFQSSNTTYGTMDGSTWNLKLPVAVQDGGQPVASSGSIRLATQTYITARDSTDSGDLNLIGTDFSDNIEIGDATWTDAIQMFGYGGQLVNIDNTTFRVLNDALSINDAGLVAASSGSLRLTNQAAINARNGGDSGNLTIAHTSGDTISYGTAVGEDGPNMLVDIANSQLHLHWGSNIVSVDENGLGFNGSDPSPQPVISGSTGGNAALKGLLYALEIIGLIRDTTT